MIKILSRKFETTDELIYEIEDGPVHFIDVCFSALDLAKVNMSGCVFDGCKLQRTRLGQLKSTKFYSCDLRQADLSQADLTDAYAINCQADGLKLMGAIISVNCNFLSGLKTSKETDGWRLVHLIALVDSPIKEILLATIPEKAKLLIEAQFAREG